MPTSCRLTTDVHGQTWIVGDGHQPIPLDTSALAEPEGYRRPLAEKHAPRYVAYRALSHAWKECYTLHEARHFCTGSSGIVRDRRAARGKWMYRLISERGNFTDLYTRPRKVAAETR